MKLGGFTPLFAKLSLDEVLAGRQRWLVVLGGLAIVVLLAVVLTRG